MYSKVVTLTTMVMMRKKRNLTMKESKNDSLKSRQRRRIMRLTGVSSVMIPMLFVFLLPSTAYGFAPFSMLVFRGIPSSTTAKYSMKGRGYLESLGGYSPPPEQGKGGGQQQPQQRQESNLNANQNQSNGEYEGNPEYQSRLSQQASDLASFLKGTSGSSTSDTPTQQQLSDLASFLKSGGGANINSGQSTSNNNGYTVPSPPPPLSENQAPSETTRSTENRPNLETTGMTASTNIGPLRNGPPPDGPPPETFDPRANLSSTTANSNANRNNIESPPPPQESWGPIEEADSNYYDNSNINKDEYAPPYDDGPLPNDYFGDSRSVDDPRDDVVADRERDDRPRDSPPRQPKNDYRQPEPWRQADDDGVPNINQQRQRGPPLSEQQEQQRRRPTPQQRLPWYEEKKRQPSWRERQPQKQQQRQPPPPQQRQSPPPQQRQPPPPQQGRLPPNKSYDTGAAATPPPPRTSPEQPWYKKSILDTSSSPGGEPWWKQAPVPAPVENEDYNNYGRAAPPSAQEQSGANIGQESYDNTTGRAGRGNGYNNDDSHGEEPYDTRAASRRGPSRGFEESYDTRAASRRGPARGSGEESYDTRAASRRGPARGSGEESYDTRAASRRGASRGYGEESFGAGAPPRRRADAGSAAPQSGDDQPWYKKSIMDTSSSTAGGEPWWKQEWWRKQGATVPPPPQPSDYGEESFDNGGYNDYGRNYRALPGESEGFGDESYDSGATTPRGPAGFGKASSNSGVPQSSDDQPWYKKSIMDTSPPPPGAEPWWKQSPVPAPMEDDYRRRGPPSKPAPAREPSGYGDESSYTGAGARGGVSTGDDQPWYKKSIMDTSPPPPGAEPWWKQSPVPAPMEDDYRRRGPPSKPAPAREPSGYGDESSYTGAGARGGISTGDDQPWYKKSIMDTSPPPPGAEPWWKQSPVPAPIEDDYRRRGPPSKPAPPREPSGYGEESFYTGAGAQGGVSTGDDQPWYKKSIMDTSPPPPGAEPWWKQSPVPASIEDDYKRRGPPPGARSTNNVYSRDRRAPPQQKSFDYGTGSHGREKYSSNRAPPEDQEFRRREAARHQSPYDDYSTASPRRLSPDPRRKQPPAAPPVARDDSSMLAQKDTKMLPRSFEGVKEAATRRSPQAQWAASDSYEETGEELALDTTDTTDPFTEDPSISSLVEVSEETQISSKDKSPKRPPASDMLAKHKRPAQVPPASASPPPSPLIEKLLEANANESQIVVEEEETLLVEEFEVDSEEPVSANETSSLAKDFDRNETDIETIDGFDNEHVQTDEASKTIESLDIESVQTKDDSTIIEGVDKEPVQTDEASTAIESFDIERVQTQDDSLIIEGVDKESVQTDEASTAIESFDIERVQTEDDSLIIEGVDKELVQTDEASTAIEGVDRDDKELVQTEEIPSKPVEQFQGSEPVVVGEDLPPVEMLEEVDKPTVQNLVEAQAPASSKAKKSSELLEESPAMESEVDEGDNVDGAASSKAKKSSALLGESSAMEGETGEGDPVDIAAPSKAKKSSLFAEESPAMENEVDEGDPVEQAIGEEPAESTVHLKQGLEESENDERNTVDSVPDEGPADSEVHFDHENAHGNDDGEKEGEPVLLRTDTDSDGEDSMEKEEKGFVGTSLVAEESAMAATNSTHNDDKDKEDEPIDSETILADDVDVNDEKEFAVADIPHKTKEEETVDSGTILAEDDNDEKEFADDEAKEEEPVDSGAILAQDNNDVPLAPEDGDEDDYIDDSADEKDQDIPTFLGRTTVVTFEEESTDIPSKEQKLAAAAASFRLASKDKIAASKRGVKATPIASNDSFTGLLAAAAASFNLAPKDKIAASKHRNRATSLLSNDPFTGAVTVASFDNGKVVTKDFAEYDGEKEPEDTVKKVSRKSRGKDIVETREATSRGSFKKKALNGKKAAGVKGISSESLDATAIEELLLRTVSDNKATVLDALGKLMKLVGPHNKHKAVMRAAVHHAYGATSLCMAVKKWAKDSDVLYLAFVVSNALAEGNEDFRKIMGSSGLVNAMVEAMSKHAKNADLQGGGCIALRIAAAEEINVELLVHELYVHENIIAAMQSFPKDPVIQYQGCVALHNLLRLGPDLKEAVRGAGAFKIVRAAVTCQEGNPEIERKGHELLGWLDSDNFQQNFSI